jgi:hypothetical protein
MRKVRTVWDIVDERIDVWQMGVKFVADLSLEGTENAWHRSGESTTAA